MPVSAHIMVNARIIYPINLLLAAPAYKFKSGAVRGASERNQARRQDAKTSGINRVRLYSRPGGQSSNSLQVARGADQDVTNGVYDAPIAMTLF
jgi:hypothetical protein